MPPFASWCACDNTKKEELKNALTVACEKLNNSADCIKATQILKCMQDNCLKPKFYFECKECALEWDYFEENLVVPCASIDLGTGIIKICKNAPFQCNEIPLSEILTHEMTHKCDNESNMGACMEYYAFKVENCIYKNSKLIKVIDKLKKACNKENK